MSLFDIRIAKKVVIEKELEVGIKNLPVKAGDRIQFLLYNRNNGQPSYGIGGTLMMESEGKVMVVENKEKSIVFKYGDNNQYRSHVLKKCLGKQERYSYKHVW